MDPEMQHFKVFHMPLFIYLFIYYFICAGFSPRSLGTNPGRLHVKFEVGEVALKKAFFSKFLQFFSDNHHSTIAPYSFITAS
jgi:hypothetical protein